MAGADTTHGIMAGVIIHGTVDIMAATMVVVTTEDTLVVTGVVTEATMVMLHRHAVHAAASVPLIQAG